MRISPRSRYFAIVLAISLFIGLMACRPTSTPTTSGVSSPVVSQPTADPASRSTGQPTHQPTAQPTISPTPQPASSPAATALSTPKPVPGGTLRLGLVGLSDTLNPITGDTTVLAELQPLLFDTLLTADPHTAELQPGLAKSWQYSADGQQVVFYLPPDLRWSDGSLLDAAALATSLRASRHPALKAFSAIEATDDHTLTLTFAAVDCPAVSNLALLPLIPTDQLTATMPTGSGPFVPQAWSEDRRVLTLAPNPHYRGSAPRLTEIVVRFLTANELEIALSEGQFDLLGPIPAPDFPVEAGQFIDIVYPAAKMIFVTVNFEAKNGDTLPLALHSILPLALDREAILTEALNGDGQLLGGSLLPQHWAADDTLTPPPPYNPAEARQKLAQAGLRDVDGDGWLDYEGQRQKIGIRVNGQNELHQNLAWLISGYYRDLGLFARAETVPAESLLDDLFTHDFQAAVFGWPILPDPDQRRFWHSAENTVGAGLNLMSYKNAQVDELLDEGASVPGCIVAERAQIYQAVQVELAQERPVDFLLAPNQHLLAGPQVGGLAPGPFAPFTWNAAEWFLMEE